MSHLFKIALASFLSGLSLAWLFDSFEAWIEDVPFYE